MKKKNFKNLLLMKSLNSLALSLINIFIPIYLLKLGYSFTTIMIYLFIHHITLLFASFGSVFLSNKFGLVRNLQIRFLFLFLFFFLFYKLENMPQLLFILPIISGIESALYWSSANILFIRNTKSKKMGSSFSKFLAYPKFFSIFGPILGGLIIFHFNFSILLIIVSTILFIAVIPLLSLKSEKTNFKFKLKSYKKIYSKNKKFIIPEIIDNLTEDAIIIWAIFVYLQLFSVIKIGILGTIIGLTIVIFTLTIGKITDNYDKKKLIKIGAILVSLAWTINFFIGKFFPQEMLLYIGTIGIVFVGQIFLVPYGTFLYNRARKDDAQFIILREIPTILGRLILFILAILLSNNLEYLFLIVGILFIYFQFFNPKK